MSFRRALAVLIAPLMLAGLTGSAFAGDTYKIDTTHSSIEFKVKHMVISKAKGVFGDYEGIIVYDAADMSKSSVEVKIMAASIDTRDEDRDNHLRSDEFLDTAKHPEITFKSKKVKKDGDGFIAIGDLTIRGVTKEVSLPFEITGTVTDPWGNERMGVEAELKINRQDYGVSFSKKLDNGGLIVGDTVEIELEVEAIKQKQG